MTPARLALMTAVGPPDCATKRFPVSSDIIFHLIRCRAEPHRPLFFGKPSKSGRNVANEPSACQSGNHKAGNGSPRNVIDTWAVSLTMCSRPENAYELASDASVDKDAGAESRLGRSR